MSDDSPAQTASTASPAANGQAPQGKHQQKRLKVAIASDHRGYIVKEKLDSLIRSFGHSVLDLGPHAAETVDYPTYAAKVAGMVSAGEADTGILCCGTGIGMCIVANKFAGVRAADCHDELAVKMARGHNDANVLCLSADLIGDRLLDQMVQTWLDTPFDGGRHQRRIEIIEEIEKSHECD